MTIYITKYIDVEVRDYEAEIELDDSEILNEMEPVDVLNFVQSNFDVATILDGIDTDAIIRHLTKSTDREALVALLHKIADRLL